MVISEKLELYAILSGLDKVGIIKLCPSHKIKYNSFIVLAGSARVLINISCHHIFESFKSTVSC